MRRANRLIWCLKNNQCLLALLTIVVFLLSACASRSDDGHVQASLEKVKHNNTQRDLRLNQQAKLHQSGNYSIPRDLPQTAVSSGYSETLIFAKNTNVRIVNDIGFFVNKLVGRLTSNTKGSPVELDDPTSFSLDLLKGDVILSTKALEAILNEHVFNFDGAPLKDLKISTSNGLLRMKAKAKRKGVWVPLELTGTLTPYQGRYLIYTPTQVSLEGNEAIKLLKIGRIDLDELLVIDTPAVKLKGSKIWLDTSNLLPPPKMNFEVAQVKVNTKGVHLILKTIIDIPMVKPMVDNTSNIVIRGGDMKLMRLLTLNAELTIVAKQQQEPLDFSFYDYRQQTSEGSLKLLADGRAIVYLENYKYLDY